VKLGNSYHRFHVQLLLSTSAVQPTAAALCYKQRTDNRNTVTDSSLLFCLFVVYLRTTSAAYTTKSQRQMTELESSYSVAYLDISESLRANFEILPQISPRPIPPTLFTIIYSLTVLVFDTIQGSLLRLATGWKVRGSTPVGARVFPFSKPIQDRFRGSPHSPLYNVNRGSSPEVKRPGRNLNHSNPPPSMFRLVTAIYQLPSCAFKPCYRVTPNLHKCKRIPTNATKAHKVVEG
jgi:hypothetical protein